MSILVTGGSGYVGSHVVNELLRKKEKVVVVGRSKNKAIDKRVKYYPGDLKNETFLNNIFKKEKIESVVHVAANIVSSSDDIKDPYDENVLATKKILNVMKKHEVNNIVFTSTILIQGGKNNKRTKSTSANPLSHYIASKLACEKLLEEARKDYGLNYVVLRCCNIIGSNRILMERYNITQKTNLLEIMLQAAIGERDKLYIFSDKYNTPDGTAIKDYIHVKDVAIAHARALNYLRKGGASEIFKIGSGKGISIKEFIKIVQVITKSIFNVEVKHIPAEGAGTLVANNKKARELLGWEPKHTDITKTVEDQWFFKLKKYNKKLKAASGKR